MMADVIKMYANVWIAWAHNLLSITKLDKMIKGIEQVSSYAEFILVPNKHRSVVAVEWTDWYVCTLQPYT